jgi:hypothetical protein
MRRYGIPQLFDTYEEAKNGTYKFFGRDLSHAMFVTVVPARKAQQLVERTVEVYSGKLVILNGEVIPYSGSEKRCSYQELLPILNRLAQQSALELQRRAAQQGRPPITLLKRVKKSRPTDEPSP